MTIECHARKITPARLAVDESYERRDWLLRPVEVSPINVRKSSRVA